MLIKYFNINSESSKGRSNVSHVTHTGKNTLLNNRVVSSYLCTLGMFQALMRLLPVFPAFSQGAVPLPSAGEGRGGRGEPTLRPKGHCGFKCAPCVARAAIALMQSDRDRCDISVPTHFHTTSHRLGVTHIPLLWSCPPAAGQHNDARMNLAIALTAARYGAAIANYTEVVHLLKRADPQTGEREGLRSALQGWDHR